MFILHLDDDGRLKQPRGYDVVVDLNQTTDGSKDRVKVESQLQDQLAKEEAQTSLC